MNAARRLKIMRLVLSFVRDSRRISGISQHRSDEAQQAAITAVWEQAGQRLERTASELTGLLVKIGQFLSMRQDLFPSAFTEQLIPLFDAVPVVPFPAMKVRMEQEWGKSIGEIFSSFNETPIAAASLAQVYKGTLKDGSVVAVKVLRQDIEQVSAVDLSTLKFAASAVYKFKRFRRWMNFLELHREFEQTIRQELNLDVEMKHIERFRQVFRNFQHRTGIEIVVPRVYPQWSSRHILVMEYLQGAKITDIQQLRTWGLDPNQIANALMDAYLHQFLVDGFIHVDPHPGNLLVQPDGRVGFLDFGMVDELTPRERNWIRRLLQSLAFGDVDGVTEALTQLGFFQISGDFVHKKEVVQQLMSGLSQLGMPSTSQETVLSRISAPFQNGSPLQLQAKYMFLLRSLGLLSTSLMLLNPNGNWRDNLMERAFPVLTRSNTPS